MTRRQRGVWVALLAVASLGFAAGFAMFLPSGTALAGSEGSITGVVTDAAGKPLRGAVVTATMNSPTSTVRSESISRWSDASGKYQITGLKPGTYKISATAYAYSQTSPGDKEIKSGATTNLPISLKPQWDLTRISTSEYLSAFGTDTEIHTKIEASCTTCHTFTWIMRRRGQTADEWAEFIPNMPNKRFLTPFYYRGGEPVAHPGFTPDRLKEIGASLEKYFGPDSELPTAAQIQHVPISDEALNETVREYMPPTPDNFSQCVNVGADGKVWFTESGYLANKVGMFDPTAEAFKEYPVPTPNARPHNIWVARNGIVWFGEADTQKLGSIDPETGKLTEYPSPGNTSHKVIEGPTGDIWEVGGDVTRFDPKTQKFTDYPDATGYMVGIDSHNNAWSSDTGKGAIDEVDSQTGKVTRYPVPGAVDGRVAFRGVAIDAQDNVWFADLRGPDGHSLGRLDAKTKQITFYKPPTPFFSGYGVWFDKKSGDIWSVDYEGASVDRFDPATQKWTVFPLPSATEITRFIAVDPQGRIWFDDFNNGQIGVLDTGESKMAAQK